MQGDAYAQSAEQNPFGAVLAALRREAGLTQEGLAEAAGIGLRTIQGLERAPNRVPHSATLDLLADALGLSAEARDRFQAAARASRSRSRSAKSSSARGAHLASAPPDLPELPPILGRDPDIAAIEAHLAAGVPLLTLLGPGGVGKTRLARSIADHRRRHGLPVLWVSLDAISSPDLLLPAIARAADVPVLGADPLPMRIAAALGPVPPLLVIDNAEHLLSAAPDLAALIRAIPRGQTLVTSREPLRLASERIVPIAPLDLPDPHDSPADLAANSAVALFLRALAAAAPERRGGEGDLPSAADIVDRLDGLPLAIELAAAQGVTMPLATISTLLETHGLDLLARGPRDAPARLQTMQAAIAWSADLLPDPASRLLRLLGAFRGGWTVEGLLAVAGRLGEPGLVAALPALADAQLVQPDPGHPGRMRMLEPIRMYAVDRLRAAGEEPVARRAHAAAYLAWARDQARLVAGPDPLPALDALDADLANLLAALNAASQPGGDLSAALQTAADLGQFWEVRGRFREGRAAIAAAIAATGPDAAPSIPLMEALFFAGYLAYMQVDLPAVETARARLQPLAAAAGLPEYLARVAILDTLAGDLADVTPANLLGPIRDAHTAVDGFDHRVSWQQSLVLTANLLLECGDATAALPLHQTYARWAAQRNEAIHARGANHWLGFDLLQLGQPAEAHRHFIAALEGSHGAGVITPIFWIVLGVAISISEPGAEPRLATRAALLHGAFDADRERSGFGLSAMQAQLRADSRARLAQSLGAEQFDALVAEGRTLSPEAVLALARS